MRSDPPTSTYPASFTYSRSRIRCWTCCGGSPSASTFRGSSSISSSRSRPPWTSTSFTPSTCVISGGITSWTWARSASGVYGPVTVYSRNGRCCSRNSRGTYGMTRGVTLAGSSSRSPASRSDSSSRAKSMSVSRSNSTWMFALPACDVDVIFSTPATCWISPSSGDVTNASTASGEEPGQSVCTDSCGSCVSGSSSSGTFRQAAQPRRATAT